MDGTGALPFNSSGNEVTSIIWYYFGYFYPYQNKGILMFSYSFIWELGREQFSNVSNYVLFFRISFHYLKHVKALQF